MADTNSGPRNITTDHATIKEWVETRGGMPARTTGQTEGPSSLYIVREDEQMEGVESLTWDEFFQTFDDEALAFIYSDQDPHASDEWFYDLVDRTEVVERADRDSTEVEQSLLEGEVVTSEITETTVIEKTVVETDQIESQIVDSETIETNLLDREIQQRELVGATFVDSDVSTTFRSETTTGDAVTRGDRTDDGVTDDDGILGDDDDDSLIGDDDDDGMLSDDDDDSLIGDDDDDGTLSDDDDDSLLGDDDDDGMLSDDDDDDGMLSDDDDDDSLLGDDDDDGMLSDDDRRTDSEASSGTDRTTQPTAETPSHSPVERSTEPPTGLGLNEHVNLEVRDSVRTKMEVFERKTIESRVVDRDIIESDTVESDAVDIDMEGLEETILQSDLIEGELAEATADTTTRETVPSGAITSERTEGDVIRSQFVERRVVETDSTEHRELTCEITDSQLTEAVDNQSWIVERAIVDRDAGEEALLHEPKGTQEVAAADSSAAASEQASQAADAETGVIAGGEAGASTDPTDDQADTVDLTEDEIGKTVVSGDEEVGMVSDVQDETLYVEPHPSLTDKIKAAFEWGDVDEETYPVELGHIESISDDTVHIRDV